MFTIPVVTVATVFLLVATRVNGDGSPIALNCKNQCKPWVWAEPGDAVSKQCKIGDRMDMRVIIGDTSAELTTDNGAFGLQNYKTYFFCPKVDKFSALTADGSAELLSTTTNMTMYASMYGAGKSSDVRLPHKVQESTATVFVPSHPKCNGEAAIASFLVYNVTYKNGVYRYKSQDPIGNGFVPTCNDEGTTCEFDESEFCIGEHGRFNCASCVETKQDKLKRQDIKILVSFYGTDVDDRPLLSGSSNPLNFRQFAVGGLYSDVKSDVNGLSDSISSFSL